MSRILIIDDEPQVRTMLRELLEDEGYEVLDAENGAQGLRIFEKESPDLVITDVVMPEKEGLQTIRELRKISQEIKIIAISGGSPDLHHGYLDVARTFGANQVFRKPVETTKLLDAIEALVEASA